MTTILKFVLAHGYSTLFAALFMRQIGFPMPGLLFLLSAGALGAAGKLNVFVAVAVAIAACVSADWLWYEAGRLKGDKVLQLMHQFTRNPDFHNRRAKRVFAQYGLPLLLVAKFVVGLDAVSPPLAGSTRTSRVRFLAFDAAGSGLYVCAYCGLGYMFSNDLDRAAAYVSRAGAFFTSIASLGIGIYIACKVIQRLRRVRGSQPVRIVVPGIHSGDSVDIPGGMIGGQQNEQ